MTLAHPPVLIGIAGGTGSGKTTVSNAILSRVGQERIAIIQHDAYYRDRAALPIALRDAFNFDHPDSLETDLMIAHLHDLKAGRAINMPVYDFTIDARSTETTPIAPQPVILVEGILIFVEPALRAMFDMRIFVDTDADIRFIRRFERDVADRGRTPQSVIQQYLSTVRPMHLEFVEPSKRYADVIIPEGGLNAVAIEMIVARIEALLRR
ncbi:MAG TPA: uridine kinase [Anaerolineales bacterium]|nr:uridine kinase [Anaerolineales bacterium]